VELYDPGGVQAMTGGLRHVLFPFGGGDEFLTGTLAFIQAARASDDAVVVAVSEPHRRLLRANLTGDDPLVSFVDAAALGRNPGRMIPAWREWISRFVLQGHVVRGIGESVWSGRGESERTELRYHEWLVNLAFATSPAWWLFCPFDTTGQDAETVRAVARCHPLLWRDGAATPGADYVEGPFEFTPLSAPHEPNEALAFTRDELGAVRDLVTRRATELGIGERRLGETLVAVTEVASNSVRHGGGGGMLRMWVNGGALVCDIEDRGVIRDPLVGRLRPTARQVGGRGLWLVHQLSDLVQIRSTPREGTRVRLHFDLPGRS
jgi:anti-sigma regulatory factor (Ser/Thr protein kinase)